MRVVETSLPGVVVIEPRVFHDERGEFYEAWNARRFAEATGVETAFVQDNHSHSVYGVLRGLHYQLDRPQGKLVRVVVGSVFDVAVDIRRDSDTFGRWVGVELSAENQRQFWIPPGFAHGFYTLTTTADVIYKVTEYYASELDRGIRWNDPEIGINWPMGEESPILSAKDADAPLLTDAVIYE